MKTRHILLAVAVLAAAASLPAEKTVAGPRGGRLLAAQPHRAEFVVTAERRVELVFYDADLKPVTPATQVVTVTAEPAGGRSAVELERGPAGFISRAPLPPGEPYRVVVQIRPAPDARPQNFRIDLNLATCGGCSRAEYACTCEGH